MNNSVVRYSRQVTTSPGIARLADDTRQFQYGNADVSGDLEHDGLTMAWISSPLRISPPEQLSFLGRVANRQLGVSQDAHDMAVKPSYGQLVGEPDVHGKTGAASGRRNLLPHECIARSICIELWTSDATIPLPFEQSFAAVESVAQDFLADCR
ncbi:hypothetical protein F2P44_16730 [Massilia sp. CCM 8695]|uniref:Penicillin-binding protein transpeptidase domain-containing protein n=1 Tax=Massilia frigida TaxID=2609281 RepID=A0ABX0N998_9BURK|nr:penicillin-binding transpeptidase domain-containing protein [Massilia frigida]NHZ80908.1 hypothetical protein [Massilia frigida]